MPIRLRRLRLEKSTATIANAKRSSWAGCMSAWRRLQNQLQERTPDRRPKITLASRATRFWDE